MEMTAHPSEQNTSWSQPAVPSVGSEEASVEWNDTHYYDDYNESAVFYVPYHLRPETYIVPAVLALIFVIGVVGQLKCQ